ncbi:MAG: hypothetical protein RLZZ591_1983 [Pseudomonadota bacterium]
MTTLRVHRMKHQSSLVRLTLALSLSLAFNGTYAAAPAAGIDVAVIKLGAQAVPTGFELDGVVQPVRQSTVSAQAAGRLATLLVKAGDRVRAGQVVATIDDRETQTGVQRSAAQVAQADAELRNASAHAQRTRDLQTQGFVSKAALDMADNQLSAAKAGREQATAGARQSALAQGYTRVTAPFDGWVLETLSEAGDLAMPGKPILTIYAPTPLRAVVQVPASRGELARSANRVEVQVPGAQGASQWLAPAARSALPAADPVSQTIEWRLDLTPVAAQGLVPGQQVRVRFVGGSADRMVLPSSAVVRRGELTGVYVASQGTFVLKAVRLGTDHGASGVEILAGLKAGDQVATDPVRAGLAGARPAGAAQ